MAINPESQYPGKIAPASSDYPYGEARNITVPGDGTGTPWDAALVNDLFGLQQSILSRAAIVPSGSPEKVGDSQYLKGLDSIFVPKTTLSEALSLPLIVGQNIILKNRGWSKWKAVAKGSAGAPDGFGVLDGNGVDLILDESGTPYADWYGCSPSSPDNMPALIAAIDANKGDLRQVHFLGGDYEFATQGVLTGNPVALVGEPWAPWQQGSTLPPVTFTWTGGATAMFSVSISNVAVVGVAVQNKGTATDFFEINAGGIRYWLHRVSFIPGTGAVPFSRSIIRSNGNRLGYSKFTSIQFFGVAPRFLDVDGQSTPNGITPVYFGDRCIFESGASLALTVVYIKDETLDTLTFENCTFNQQGAELTVVDTTDTPLPTAIREFNYLNNEWDYSVANAATDRAMRLENVDNARIVGSDWQMGGLVDHAIELINTRLSTFEGNGGASVATSVINADPDSRINIGANNFNKSNVPLVVNDSAEGQLLTIPWVAGNVFIIGEEVPHNVNSIQVIEPASSAGWTLTFRHGSQGYFVPGQIVTIQLKNTTGGGISAGTPSTAIKTAGALVAPATGYSRFYTFIRTTAGFMEISRSAADVPNV